MNKRREEQRSVVFLAGAFLIFGLVGFLSAPEAARAANSDIVINEIAAYEAAEHEWIEIYNKGTAAVNMTGWVFNEDGTNHGLSAYQGDLIIGPGEYAIIADNAAIFASSSPAFSGTIIDSAWTTLSSDGELIELRSSANVADTVESFTYIAASSASLERANPRLTDYSAANWQVRASGNSAGAENSNYVQSAGVCGNGILEFGEECDDHNTESNDGCSSLCESENEISGTVLFTVALDLNPAQNIGTVDAEIVFHINADGRAKVKYGLSAVYGNESAEKSVLADAEARIKLDGLSCGTQYHFAAYAENELATESDQSADAVFTTLPCGITIDSLVMSKTAAKANNNYENGWEWRYEITVWDMQETDLKMKFSQWSGPGALSAGGNMRFSADNGATWNEIIGNDAYPASGTNIGGIDRSVNTGRQVALIVQMKVPTNTRAGQYGSNYGILAEKP